jgi:hypothetical protein
LRLITWKDRITDTSNIWLNAVRMNNDHKFEEATVLYLKDSVECLKKGLLTRAALSCSCAADCQEKMGRYNDSRRLYAEAARLYDESARSSFGRSVRESLWLLQQSSDYYSLVGDKQKASEILDKYLSLARRVDPFAVVDDGNGPPARTTEKKVLESVGGGSELPQSAVVMGTINDFLRLRNQQQQQQEELPKTVSPQWNEKDKTGVGNERRLLRRNPNETIIVS